MRRAAVDALISLGEPSEDDDSDPEGTAKNHKDPYVAKKAGSILGYWGLK